MVEEQLMNKIEIQHKINILEEAKISCFGTIKRYDQEIERLQNLARDRCPEYDGVLRCELKAGHEGDHYAEYMGG